MWEMDLAMESPTKITNLSTGIFLFRLIIRVWYSFCTITMEIILYLPVSSDPSEQSLSPSFNQSLIIQGP